MWSVKFAYFPESGCGVGPYIDLIIAERIKSLFLFPGPVFQDGRLHKPVIFKIKTKYTIFENNIRNILPFYFFAGPARQINMRSHEPDYFISVCTQIQ